jgi:fatty acid desaturase
LARASTHALEVFLGAPLATGPKGIDLSVPPELCVRSNLWIAIYAAKPFALIAAGLVPVYLGLVGQGLWLVPAMLLFLMAQRHFQTIVHDSSHGFFSHDRRLNDLLGNWLAAGWTGVEVNQYRRIHMQHHAHNGSIDDPEHVSFETVRRNGGLLRMILSYALMLESVTLVRKYFFAKEQRPARAKPAAPKPLASRLMGLSHIAGCQVMMIALCVGSGFYLAYPAWLYLAVTWNPLFSRLRFLAEHPGEDDTTVTTIASWVERSYFAPQSFNYHFEHHAWPVIPPYRLRGVHKSLRASGFYENRQRNLSGSFVRTLIRQSPPAGL